MQIERTEIAQAHFNSVTSEIPIVVSDSARLDMFPVEDFAAWAVGEDVPLECGIENPEGCEACD